MNGPENIAAGVQSRSELDNSGARTLELTGAYTKG